MTNFFKSIFGTKYRVSKIEKKYYCIEKRIFPFVWKIVRIKYLPIQVIEYEERRPLLYDNEEKAKKGIERLEYLSDL